MEQFAQWFIEFFQELINNLWGLIKGFAKGFYNLIIGYPIQYAKSFLETSKNFAFMDWVLAIFSIIIFIFLIFMILGVIYQLLKRYFRFTKIEYQKLDLLNRINVLERKLKKQSLPFQENFNKPSHQNQLTTKKEQRPKTSRFVRLNQIDEKYKYAVLPTPMTQEDKLTLSQLVTRFRDYAAYEHKLYYDRKTISTFIAGMAVSKIMILEGISGTGKTSLPYAFGKFIKNDATIISVQPSWRDRFEMIGYLNEFTKKFSETEFLTAVYEANYRTDIQMIVLDEMNLARVEYYFADFLSLLELPNKEEWMLNLIPEQLPGDPMGLKEGKMKIAPNIWFVGTANKDDSTFAITDKVYDRASSIEMNSKAEKFEIKPTKPINLSYDYLETLFSLALESHSISPNVMEAIIKLDQHIAETFEVTFGNRILKQLENFVPVFMACGQEEISGVDYIIARKVIRKFESLNLPFLQKELEELLVICDKLFGKDKLFETKKMIQKFLRYV